MEELKNIAKKSAVIMTEEGKAYLILSVEDNFIVGVRKGRKRVFKGNEIAKIFNSKGANNGPRK